MPNTYFTSLAASVSTKASLGVMRVMDFLLGRSCDLSRLALPGGLGIRARGAGEGVGERGRQPRRQVEDFDSGLFERVVFGIIGPARTQDNGAGVAHALADR